MPTFWKVLNRFAMEQDDLPGRQVEEQVEVLGGSETARHRFVFASSCIRILPNKKSVQLEYTVAIEGATAEEAFSKFDDADKKVAEQEYSKVLDHIRQQEKAQAEAKLADMLSGNRGPGNGAGRSRFIRR